MKANSNESARQKPGKVEERHDLSLIMQKIVLQMCWAQHDAQWFLKSKKRLGTEGANDLNMEVIFSMGKIEARHVMNALNIGKEDIRSIFDMFKLINTFMHVFIPEVMKFDMVALSETEGSGIVEKCFIWEMVKRSKGEAEYECACNSRHRGWLEAMGGKGKITPVKLLPKGDEMCEFRFTLE